MAKSATNQLHLDQYLTNFATRYNPTGVVADFIAPSFRVKNVSGKYAAFGKGNVARVYDNKIGRREEPKEVDFDSEDKSYACEEYGLAGFVAKRDEENTDKPFTLMEEETRKVKNGMLIAREQRVLNIAASASIVTQTSSPGTKWDVKATGAPISNILKVALPAINSSQFQPANKIVMSYEVALAISDSDDYVDRVKFVESGFKNMGVNNIVEGLRILGLEARISNIFGMSTPEGSSSDPATESLLGDSVLIFRGENTPSLNSRTFMYSPFRERDVVKKKYVDEQRGTKIMMFEDIDELLVDASAAYLFTSVLT